MIVFLVLNLFASCTKTGDSLVMFYAPCYSPVLDALADDSEKELGVKLRVETAGSQVCCRKVTELNRECDLLMLADSGLFKSIAASRVNWRIDFAHDSIVLGIGSRAKRTDEAETDWTQVLLDEKTVLGRVDENLGPIGYRTLLVWKLKENLGYPALAAKLRQKASRVVDHVAQLATLLKAGDIDYGFLYRTTCLKYDIRFVELDPKVNLGSEEIDYSSAEVTFSKLKAGAQEAVTVKGSLITYGLTVPENAPNSERAIGFVGYLLQNKKDHFTARGFSFFKPRFYGTPENFKPFEDFADYAGGF